MKKKVMNETEWLTCDDPIAMLRRARFRSYPRKSRLFAVACCRCIWHMFIDERSRKAVVVAERHADGNATDEELLAACKDANQAHSEIYDVLGKSGSCIEWAAAYAANLNPFHGAKNVTWMAATPRFYEVRRPRPDDFDEIHLVPCTITKRTGLTSLVLEKWNVEPLKEAEATGADKPIQAALIRCIFGNPFRPVHIDPAWLTPDVIALAQAIYDERRFADLPILADALEEAGCTSDDILSHCREGGKHARGCWPVDLLLGKS